jgi:hypothetical protein
MPSLCAAEHTDSWNHFLMAYGAGVHMLDFFYVLVGLVLFIACWAFTKGCDRL